MDNCHKLKTFQQRVMKTLIEIHYNGDFRISMGNFYRSFTLILLIKRSILELVKRQA